MTGWLDWLAAALSALGIAAVTIRKVVVIMGILRDLGALFIAVTFIVFGHEVPGQNGADKKAAALAKVKEILAAPGGFDWPAWLAPYQDVLLGLAIDMAVLLANRSGFFARSSGGSPS